MGGREVFAFLWIAAEVEEHLSGFGSSRSGLWFIEPQIFPVAFPNGVLHTPSGAPPKDGPLGRSRFAAQMWQDIHAVDFGARRDTCGCEHARRPVKRCDNLLRSTSRRYRIRPANKCGNANSAFP